MMRLSYVCVYQFKITLKGIKPPIWRRIQVPCSYTFWDLSVALQDAMGWFGYNGHLFEVRHPLTGHREHIGIPDLEAHPDADELSSWGLHLSQYFTRDNRSAKYIYDFNDWWELTLRLERILPRALHLSYPRCLGGARVCPPEDIGGVIDYGEFLEIVGNPDHEEHQRIMEWVGQDFDPERFNPDEIWFDDPRARLQDFLA